ncbi:MAG: hypothetical protein GY771_02470 [bacterium]|nr:hypothetical protein [bacterium]
MNRRIITWAAVLSVMLVAGCIDYEQTITINDDLSGTAEFNIGMNPNLGDNMNEDGSMSDTPRNFLVEDFSEVPGCKIEDDSYSYDAETEMEHFSAKLKLDDLNGINGYGLYEENKTLSVTEENGVITYREVLMVSRGETPPDTIPDDEMSEDEKMMREMMEGYSFTYRVVMPSNITETNGEIGEDGRTVTWTWPTSEFFGLGEIEVFAKCAE